MHRPIWILSIGVMTLAVVLSPNSDRGRAAQSPIRTSDGNPDDSTSLRADAGRVRGLDTATISLIEVGDFECIACKAWHELVFPSIEREFVKTGAIRFTYLNFASARHPHAQAAAEAAMCASALNQFWPMYDSLFVSQGRWVELDDPTPIFESFVREFGVDVLAWRKCVSEHATAALISNDRLRVERMGISATPTFIVGNKKLEGASASGVRDLIVNELARIRKP